MEKESTRSKPGEMESFKRHRGAGSNLWPEASSGVRVPPAKNPGLPPLAKQTKKNTHTGSEFCGHTEGRPDAKSELRRSLALDPGRLISGRGQGGRRRLEKKRPGSTTRDGQSGAWGSPELLFFSSLHRSVFPGENGMCLGVDSRGLYPH